MPSGLLGNEASAPARPMRAANKTDEISTPQMIRVTVTCLVSAIEESCDCSVVRDQGQRSLSWTPVTTPPQNEREPSARGGTDASVPPPRHSYSKLPLIHRYKNDGAGGTKSGH